MSDRFNEREFEFCFNAEFVRRHQTALAGALRMPSPRLENILGYDVQFRLRSGNFTRSLFIQHKVSTYASKRSGKNSEIWRCYHGPYFRFPIEKITRTQQHNLLVELAINGEDVYYCAPLFIEFTRLQTHFLQNQVLDYSLFFSPASMGRITDFKKHCVSYDPSGSFGFFHSDAKKIPELKNWKQLINDTDSKRVDSEYATSLLTRLNKSVESVLEATPMIPKEIQQNGSIVTIVYMLRRYFNVEWLILP